MWVKLTSCDHGNPPIYVNADRVFSFKDSAGATHLGTGKPGQGVRVTESPEEVLTRFTDEDTSVWDVDDDVDDADFEIVDINIDPVDPEPRGHGTVGFF